MGIMDRLSRLIRANVNDLIDRAEDPEKMLEQILRDMQSNIQTARSQVAAMIAQEKELEADAKESRTLALQWSAKAQRAVDAGRDDLAREALRRRHDNEENARVYTEQYQAQKQMVDKLKVQLRQLEAKYEQTLSQRDTLIARRRRAEAQKQVTQSLTSLSPLDPSNELERMERRIRSEEAQATAIGELATTGWEAQFDELDYDVEIEEELTALKAGRIDLDAELEALKAGRGSALSSGSAGELGAGATQTQVEQAPTSGGTQSAPSSDTDLPQPSN